MKTAQEKQAIKKVLKSVLKWCLFVMLPIIGGGYLSGEPIGNYIISNEWVYCTLIWVAFTILSAHFEAHYYQHEISSSFKENFNEHPLFVGIRLCVLIPLWIISSWKVVICLICLFPFLHDGQYYTTRNNLSGIYSKRWFAQSTTSTALTTHFFTPIARTIWFVIGLTLLILWHI